MDTKAAQDLLDKRAGQFDSLEKTLWPTNRYIARQWLGIKYFGVKYLVYLWARVGMKYPKTIVVTLFCKCKITLPLERYSAQLFFAGMLPEIPTTRFMMKAFAPGIVFYDIGANYGFYSHLAGHYPCQSYAFEPSPRTYHYLESNKGPATTTKQMALGSFRGTIPFYDVDNSSGFSTTLNEIADNLPLQHHRVDVTSESLDHFLENNPAPQLIKIDVEGAEKSVLEGGKKFLTEHNPTILMEVWAKSEFSKRAVDTISEFGYQPFEIKADGDLSEVSKDEAWTTGGNIVFKKK